MSEPSDPGALELGIAGKSIGRSTPRWSAARPEAEPLSTAGLVTERPIPAPPGAGG
jgi:hypothetical protein